MKQGNWCRTQPHDCCKQEQKIWKQLGYLHEMDRIKIEILEKEIKDYHRNGEL